MFGPITDLGTFVRCSQYMQAEGLRFIIEADRRRKYQNSGCIIWQLNEPWPNASCTNLVDYFGEAKPAYYLVKKAYAPVHISLTYRKLDYETGELFSEKITVHNSNGEFEGRIVCRVRNLDGSCVIQKEFLENFSSNCSIHAADIKFKIENVSEVFFIELQLFNEKQLLCENVYLFALKKEHLLEPLMNGKAEVRCEVLDSKTDTDKDEMTKTVRIMNIGSEAAVHAGIELVSDGYFMLADDNYVILFPQEEKVIKLRFKKKKTGTFFSEENLPENEKFDPELKAVWFGCDRTEG
jgi:beta-mannosidase